MLLVKWEKEKMLVTSIFSFSNNAYCLILELNLGCTGFADVLNSNAVVNPLPDMPVLGSSNSTAKKNMMSKIWTNGGTII